MIRQVMPEFHSKDHIIILCDSWYTKQKSVQEFRFELSQGIRSQIFFAPFVKNIETHIKSNAMTKALKQLIHQQVYHL